MQNPFDDLEDFGDFDANAPVPLHECCICHALPVTAVVHIETEHFPFCAGHDQRSAFLQRGQQRGWPALRIEGITGRYALEGDAMAWVLTALQGTDERVVELLEALDEWELAQKKSA